MGFDNECILHIQNLAGEYFCPVCRMLVYPNEALQSQCTHLYCQPCLAYIVATTRACPYDGYLVTQEDSKPLSELNKTLAETIGMISVQCLYHRSGCTWQGPLSDCLLHCSACAFGNSPVVCNRCALQIVHSQVQEHAQTCPGVPSQGQSQTAEGTLSFAVSKSPNQMQANMQGAAAYSQAALPVSNLSHQQQHYQQSAGYDPYQLYYQHVYQQQQELVQHPHLQPRLQVQSLPPPMPHPQVQALPQQLQQPSIIHTQPPAQQYPQSQAISVIDQQTQSHPMVPPQSHIHLQSHTYAQPLTNPPRPYPHAHQPSQLQLQQLYMSQCQQNLPHVAQLQPQPQPLVQLQQSSQVNPHPYPPQASFMDHYPSISHKHVDHLYYLQSKSGNPWQPLGYPIPKEGHNQRQKSALQIQNQITQPLINPTESQPISQQNPWLVTSLSQNQIVPTAAQPNHPRLEHPHMLHHRPPVQASGQLLAPQQQQVPVTTHRLMHSQMQSNVTPSLPLQDVALPHNEPPHQFQSQVGSDYEQPQAYLVNAESFANSGSCKHLGTPNGSQSEPNNVSVEITGAGEGKETSLIEDKSMTSSGDKVPSDEKGVKEDRVNDSEEHNSVSISGSVLSDLKEGNPDKIKSKRADSQNIQQANGKDEVAGSIPLVIDSERQMIINASPYAFEGNASFPSCLIPHSRNSFVERRSYIHHSGSYKEANMTPACMKDRLSDSSHSFGWPQDKILLEQGSVRVLRGDLEQLPSPSVESELLRKQGGFLTSIPCEMDSFGVHMIPRPLEKSIYGLHHDKHLQAAAFPEDTRLNLSHDFRSAASVYSRQFGVPPDREHPTVSSHAIRHCSRGDFQLGTDGRDQSLIAPVTPLNPLSDSAGHSFISSTFSNQHPRVHRGRFSAQTHNAESSGHGSISVLGEVGYRSHSLLTENRSHKGDLELYENMRKRKAGTMGWCRICEVDCDTVEGLDLHSQTREHQRMSMDMVLKIKQQNLKRKRPSHDYIGESM